MRYITLFTLLAGGILLAQDRPPSPAPPFRAGANLVRVDVYASKDGVPITDLRQDDFEIREDGAAQTIESFEYVSVPTGGSEAARVQPNSIEAGRQMAADPRARVFVVFLDSYHMDPQAAQQLRTPVRRFLEEALGPDDLVAVITPEESVASLTFTRRTTVLAGLLAKTTEWMLRDHAGHVRPLDEEERLLERCFPLNSPTFTQLVRRRREQRTLDALQALTLHLGALRDERKTVLVATLGWELYEPDARIVSETPNPGQPGTHPLSTVAGAEACRSAQTSLSRLDHRNRMRAITGDANRNNVSFYPLSPLRGGVSPSPTGPGGLLRLSALREMAEETDGTAIVNTNEFAGPMQKLIADSASYYLLGYQSTNTKDDGRFRRITVVSRRPGLTIRARRGYRALSAAEVKVTTARPAAAPADDAVVRAVSGLASAAVAVPLRLRATAWSAASGTGGSIRLIGELDAALRTRREWTSGGSAEIMVLQDGGAGARQRTDVPPAGTFGVTVPVAGANPTERFEVRVVLRPSGGGESVSQNLFVSAGAGVFRGPALIHRQGPGTGGRMIETADPRVRRGDQLRLEVPVTSMDGVTARLVDRNGQLLAVPVSLTSRQDPADDLTWLLAHVALAPLSPGDYAVVLTGGGESQVTGFRVTP